MTNSQETYILIILIYSSKLILLYYVCIELFDLMNINNNLYSRIQTNRAFK